VICRRRTSVRSLPRAKKPPAEGYVRQLGDGHWEIRIKRELPSANKTLWAHWRVKQRERAEWERALNAAAAAYAGVTTTAGLAWLKKQLSLFVPPGEKVRRRVVVTRLVPSKRRFCRDDINLDFAHKHLVDAMKQIGMITEDSRKWLDCPRPTEAVSPDGEAWTIVELQTIFESTKAPAPPAGGLLS